METNKASSTGNQYPSHMSSVGGYEAQLTEDSPKLLFLVPRFHTNMIGWVEALIERGVKVTLIAVRQEFSEDHFLVEPLIIPSYINKLNRRMPISGNLKRKLTSPKFSLILAECKKFAPDRIVVRFELDLTSLKYLLAARCIGKPIFIYTQWPVANTPLLKKFLLISIKLIFRTTLFSPVYQFGFSTLDLTQINNPKKIDNNFEIERRLTTNNLIRWVPFTLSKKHSRFIGDSRKLHANAIKFTSIGKFTERKNLIQVLEIFCNNQTFLNSESTLTIIGELTTPEHYEIYEKLSRMLHEYKVLDKVQLISNISHDLVLEYLSKSDVFVLQSRNEPASISVIEAMACGNLLLLDSQSGTADYSGLNYGALPINSKNDLSTCLDYLHMQSDVIERLQARNVETFGTFFEISVVGDLLYEILF